MDERMADRITDEVLRRLRQDGPAALLIGTPPPETPGCRLTDRPPYSAVVIGSLTAGELLCLRDDRIYDALLEGKPVYLWEPGLAYRTHSSTANRALYGRLTAAERQLRQMGVQFYGGSRSHRLITAEQARAMAACGETAPEGAVLTPLAREILGGGHP